MALQDGLNAGGNPASRSPRRSPVKATIRIGFVNPSSPWIAIARRFQHGYTEI
jgi:hypothetical protein